MAARDARAETQPSSPSPRTGITLRDFAEAYFRRRRAEGGRSVSKDEGLFQKRILPALGALDLSEITRKACRDFILSLWTERALRPRRGEKERRRLAPRYVRRIGMILRRILQVAVDDEILDRNAAAWRPRELPKARDADVTWRVHAVYTREEAVRLISDEKVRALTRVVIAIDVFTGPRSGELAALRWMDLEAPSSDRPLGRLLFCRSYSTQDRAFYPTKTSTSRDPGVHPALRAILEDWHEEGWAKAFGRAPTPEDLIVPVKVRGELVPMRNDGVQQRLETACRALGIRYRSPHALRATFATLLRADGATEALVRALIHNPPSDFASDVLSGYTRFSDKEKAKAILQLNLELGPTRDRGEP